LQKDSTRNATSFLPFSLNYFMKYGSNTMLLQRITIVTSFAVFCKETNSNYQDKKLANIGNYQDKKLANIGHQVRSFLDLAKMSFSE